MLSITNGSSNEEMADLLNSNEELIIINADLNLQAHIQHSSNGFDYSIYALSVIYNEDKEEFESEAIDGGICENGDELDAINHLTDMMHGIKH